VQVGNIKKFSGGIQVSSNSIEMFCKTGLTIYSGNVHKSTRPECTDTGAIFNNNVITPLDRQLILPYGLRMSLTR
jgi:hypothetical protein